MFKITAVMVLLILGICYAAQDVAVEPLRISVRSTIVTVGSTATKLPTTAFSGRKVITVQNLEPSAIIYLGGSTVTADEASTGGLQLMGKGDSWTGDVSDANIIYGITTAASGNSLVAVIEAR